MSSFHFKMSLKRAFNGPTYLITLKPDPTHSVSGSTTTRPDPLYKWTAHNSPRSARYPPLF